MLKSLKVIPGGPEQTADISEQEGQFFCGAKELSDVLQKFTV